MTDSALAKSATPSAAKTNNAPKPLIREATQRRRKPWKVSDKLLQFLGIWENGVANGKNFAHQIVTDGYILVVYKDSRGFPTVGCGHLVVSTDRLKVGEVITKDRAKQLLKNDLRTAERAINHQVKVPLLQNEYDALISIAFNAGAHGVSKLVESVNKGEYTSIPGLIKHYRTGGGNMRRRNSEASLFKSGTYNANH